MDEEEDGRDRVEDEDGASVGFSDPVRLDFDADLRIEGVRRLSRAFGSSSLVYLPIAGRWTTWKEHDEWKDLI